MNHHTSSYNSKGRKGQFQAESGDLDWWLWPLRVSAFQRTCQVSLCLWPLSRAIGPVWCAHSIDHPEWFSHLSPGQNLGQGTVSEPFVYWESPGVESDRRTPQVPPPQEGFLLLLISSVQSLSRVWLFATPWTAACQASLSSTSSQSLLKLMSIASVMLPNHLILCRSLLLLPSVFPSIRVFSSESVLHIRWPKYWSFSFNISPSNEHPGLISFRMDWLDLLTVQGTLKSLLQHHSSKASILQRSAFFIVQLSQPYMTTGKSIPFLILTGKLSCKCCPDC